jgi:uncharacterized Ntn-hydrolase superfamily protein
MSRPSTFSIVAADPQSQEVGVAVASKFLAAGAQVPWVRSGVGAAATQAATNVEQARRSLDLLGEGLGPQAALDRLLEGDEQREGRQLGVVDAGGTAASFTGRDCYRHARSMVGSCFAAQGNLLASADVVSAMADTFESSRDDQLPERLVAALRSGQAAGGDRRGQESAALLVARADAGYGKGNDVEIDLRVDHHPTPVEELTALLSLHRLYFQKSPESELLIADAALECELESLLRRKGWLEQDQDLWTALFHYMNWENLEERWVGHGRIDPTVLEFLRRP